ncbi:hypothetical protein M405DRAFT_880183 [Rhizopogon salebrosus TDB-379]|nr:hypothetical protein M405DRAFT_880183 [Rhizopogon salebrosus TDB-379]
MQQQVTSGLWTPVTQDQDFPVDDVRMWNVDTVTSPSIYSHAQHILTHAQHILTQTAHILTEIKQIVLKSRPPDFCHGEAQPTGKTNDPPSPSRKRPAPPWSLTGRTYKYFRSN